MHSLSLDWSCATSPILADLYRLPKSVKKLSEPSLVVSLPISAYKSASIEGCSTAPIKAQRMHTFFSWLNSSWHQMQPFFSPSVKMYNLR